MAAEHEDSDLDAPMPLIGIVRHGDEPASHETFSDTLRWMCAHGGQHKPPDHLVSETLRRLDNGDSARDVAQWLRGQYLEASGTSPSWLGFMLDPIRTPRPTRQQVLDQLDELERKEGPSEQLRDARQQLLEAPDDFFGEG
jgi:hypothetical protein